MSATFVPLHEAPAAVRRPRQIPWLGLGLLCLLLLLIVAPLVFLLRASLTPEGEIPFTTDVYTAANYARVLSSPDLLSLISNTLQYAVTSVVFGVVVAFGIAWLVERTDMPLPTFIRTMMYSWMAVPTIVLAFGWILLANPGSGLINLLLRKHFGFEGSPVSIYSMTAMTLITGMAIVPTAFAMIAGLLKNMDPQLESAATVHGASGFSVFRHVTIPLLTPGLFSVGILLIMAMVQAFDFPLVLGLTAKIHVLSTRIYLLAHSDVGRPDYTLPATFGIFFLILAALLMLSYFRTVRMGERFRVVTGKAFRPRRIPLGALKVPAVAVVALYFLVMLLPLLVLLWTSLQPFYAPPSAEAWQRLTFANFRLVMEEGHILRAIGHTVILVLCSATLVMVLSVVIAWQAVRTKSKLSRTIELLSFAPMAMPPVVLAVAILLIYLRTPLYGTIWLIVLAHVTAYIAFGTRTMHGALLQLHQELENAALVCGASWFTMMVRVVFPLLRAQIVNGWLWVAAHSARDITFPLFLITATNVVLSSELWILWEQPAIPLASALSILLVLGLLVAVVPAQLIAARSLAKVN